MLVIGGRDSSNTPLSSCELFNVTSRTWSITGQMSYTRYWLPFPAAVKLADGRVLVAGGGSSGPSTSEVYDPATRSWTNSSEAMPYSFGDSAGHQLALLADGRVLMVGGGGVSSVYNVGLGSWSTVGSLGYNRQNSALVLLPSGFVMSIGGYDGGTSPAVGSLPVGESPRCELFNPATGQWSSTGSMVTGRSSVVATFLPNAGTAGLVVVIGGYLGWPPSPRLDSEVYDVSAGTWSRVGDCKSWHYQGAMSTLNGMYALAVGGYNAVAGTEIYDPVSRNWTRSGNLLQGRNGHGQSVVASSGDVVVSGGISNTQLSSTEMCTPAPYIPPEITCPADINASLSCSPSIALTFSPTASGADSVTCSPASGTDFVKGSRTVTCTATKNSPSASDSCTFKVRVAAAAPFVSSACDSSWTSVPGFPFDMLVNPKVIALNNGKALVVGGTPLDGSGVVRFASLFDPSTNSWSQTGSNLYFDTRSVAVATLEDGSGRVVGLTGSSVTIYNPASNVFSTGSASISGETVHFSNVHSNTLTALLDGTVLAAAGQMCTCCSPDICPTNASFIYNVSNNTWRRGPSLAAAVRWSHSATLLADDRVLVAGGRNPYTNEGVRTCELYTPSTDSWSTVPGPDGPARVDHSAFLLPNGKVLLVGGSQQYNDSAQDLFDPSAAPGAAWSRTLSPPTVRAPATVQLADGRVLLISGANNDSATSSNVIWQYSPSSNSWQRFAYPQLRVPVSSSGAVQLNNGKVLVVGGYSDAAVVGPQQPGIGSALGTINSCTSSCVLMVSLCLE